METMTYIDIGILERRASEAIAAVASGETVTITQRGKPIAQLSPIPQSPLESLIESGRARRARRSVAALEVPDSGQPLSATLTATRDDQRW
jgi:prevent-host-death family protein